ncbi:MAG: hypothetical protein GX801_00860 [Fibrobacter sp.]|nr:hypothetical protein [Fibrobacter sp.]
MLLSNYSFALQRVVGANSSSNLVGSAELAAMANNDALTKDILSLNRNPLVLLSAKDSWLGMGHNALFEGSHLHLLAENIPLKEQSFGFSVARFGTDGIIWSPEGEEIPVTMPTKTMSAVDWNMTLAWARTFCDEKLDVGANVHLLWRNLDQSGLGFSGDLAARWKFNDDLAILAQLQNFFSSLTVWRSGYKEFSPPEAKIGLVWGKNISYLYGNLRLGWQSADILHRRNQEYYWSDYLVLDSLAQAPQSGKTLWNSPLSWIKASALGAELQWKWGGSIRLGLMSFESIEAWSLGMGMQISSKMKLDYAYQNHPVLNNLHRVSLALKLWENPKVEHDEDTVLDDEREEFPESGRVFWED